MNVLQHIVIQVLNEKLRLVVKARGGVNIIFSVFSENK